MLIRERLARSLLYAISILIPISYHPFFFNEKGEQVGRIGDIIAVIILFIFIILSQNLKGIFKSPFIKNYFVFFVIISIEVSLCALLGLNISISEIRELAIPLLILIVGYNCPLNDKAIKTISYLFIVTMLFVGFEQIRINIGGFVIDDIYKTSAKNSVGPMLALGGLCSLWYALSEKKKIIKGLFFITTLLFFIEILTIRARLATLAYVAVLLYVLIIKYKSLSSYDKSKSIIFLIFSIIAGFFIFHQQLNDLKDYIFDSFFQNKESGILSGRENAYSIAFQHLVSHPIFGNLVTDIKIPWVHNYILLKLSNFGYIGGLPFTILYLYIIVYTAKKLLKAKSINNSIYGFVLLCIPLIVSIGEPTFPYGPGTANFLPYLIVGVNLNSLNSVNHQ